MVAATPTVVIAGSGYAGALAAARLVARSRRVQVVLVTPDGQLLERVRLHQFLAHGRPVQRPANQLLGERVRIVQARVLDVQPERRVVVTTEGELHWDALLMATGSVGRAAPADADAQVTDVTLASLTRLRARLPELQRVGGRVVVCGGGPTGVEVAAELAEAWPGIHVSIVSNTLPIQELGRAAAERAMALLKGLGVEVVQGAVQRVSAGRVVTSFGDVLADEVIWAAGVDAELPPGESFVAGRRLEVDAALRVSAWPGVFGAGDAVAFVDEAGAVVPMGCKTAMPMAAHAADNILCWLKGRPLAPFRWKDPGATVAVGRRAAVGVFPSRPGQAPMVVTGRWVAGVKALLCAWVVLAIQWQARGWIEYRWLQPSLKQGRKSFEKQPVMESGRV